MENELDELIKTGRYSAGSSLAYEITNEFVRSYGFKGDPETGEWGWSTENIKEAWRDHPYITAIDYLTWAVPVAKWGVVSARVLRGSSAVGRAYQAGEMGEKGVRAFRKAATMEASLPPKSKLASTLYSPVNMHPDAEAVLRRHALDPRDKRALGFFADREKRVLTEFVRRQHEDITRMARGVDEETGKGVTRLLEMAPGDDPAAWKNAYDAIDRKGHELYQAQFKFRNWLHESSFHYGLIREETYRKNLERYVPRGYDEFEKITREVREKVWGSHRIGWKEGTKHFLARTADEHPDLTRILDPAYTTDAMARASMVVVQQAYAIGLARNGLLKSHDDLVKLVNSGTMTREAAEMWPRMFDLFPGKPPGAKATAALRTLEARSRTLKRREDAHLRMWKTTEDVLGGQTEKVLGMRMREVSKYRAARGRLGSIAARGRGFQDEAATLGIPEGRLVDAHRRQLSAAKVAAARSSQRAKDLGEEVHRLAIGEQSSWKRMRKHLAKERDKILRERDKLDAALSRERAYVDKPMFLKRLPHGETAQRLGLVDEAGNALDLAEMRVDPAIVDGLKGALKTAEDNPIIAFYKGALRAFKITRTAYNPATHSRNFLGNFLFHMMATGMRNGPPVPVAGIRAYVRRSKYWDDALKTGVIGGGVDKLTYDTWTKIHVPKAGENVASWIERIASGEGFAAALAKKGKGADSFVRRFYMAGDEVWKLDAFIKQHRFALKKLKKEIADPKLRRERATEMATLEVMRFFPNYLQSSPLNEMMQNVIPFFGFTSESVRVWKNAMIYKPHVAFFLQRYAEIGSHMLANAGGIQPEELESARQSLPWYTEGRKMMLWPFRGQDDSKIAFLDLSYITPGFELGSEAEQAESMFWGIPAPMQLFQPGANPFIGIFAAGITGKDPFHGRPVEPRFTERQLGVAVTKPSERWAIGMVEYTARAIVPPLVPPNYIGMNLIDLAKGTKSGVTNEAYQQSVGRTIAANLFGLRTYEPTVGAQIGNIRREQRLTAEESSAAWNRWELAMANGDFARAAKEQQRITDLRGPKFFADNWERHVPGTYRNLGEKDLLEVIRRARTYQADPEELWPIWARWLEIQRRK